MGSQSGEMSFRLGTFRLRTRFLLFAVFGASGIVLQLVLLGTGSGAPGAFAPGVLVMIAGLFPLLARPYTNRPLDLGHEDWQPASEAEVERIDSNFRLTKSVRYPLYYRVGFGIFIVILLVLLAVFSAVMSGTVLAAFFFLDAVVLLWPFLFFGSVRLFVPGELKMKLDTFRPLLDADRPASVILTPYLRLDRDEEGKRIPEDIRLMLEPRRKPEDFVGAQVQVAVNNGPNGKVPYMYAVFLTRGTEKSYKRLSKRRYRSWIVEPASDGEYGTIVLRQKTSGTGYHTKAKDCGRLYAEVLAALEDLPAQ